MVWTIQTAQKQSGIKISTPKSSSSPKVSSPSGGVWTVNSATKIIQSAKPTSSPKIKVAKPTPSKPLTGVQKALKTLGDISMGVQKKVKTIGKNISIEVVAPKSKPILSPQTLNKIESLPPKKVVIKPGQKRLDEKQLSQVQKTLNIPQEKQSSAKLTPQAKKRAEVIEKKIKTFTLNQLKKVGRAELTAEKKIPGYGALQSGIRETVASFIANTNPKLAERYNKLSIPQKDNFANKVMKFIGQQVPYIPLVFLTEGMVNPVTSKVITKIPKGTNIATHILSQMAKGGIRIAPITGILSGIPATETVQDRAKNIGAGVVSGLFFGAAWSGLGTGGAEIVNKFGKNSKSFLANKDLILKVVTGKGTPEELKQFHILNETGLTAQAARGSQGISVTQEIPKTGKVWNFLRKVFPNRFKPDGTVKPEYAPQPERVAPPKGSVEEIIETKGGWKPGMRKQFDEALMKKDTELVKRLLPDVPKEYAKRFSEEIAKIVGAEAKPLTNFTPLVASDNVGLAEMAVRKQMGLSIADQLPKGEQTPAAIIGTIIKNGLDKTPEGKELIKEAAEAQRNGKNIVINKVEPKPSEDIPSELTSFAKEVVKYDTAEQFIEASKTKSFGITQEQAESTIFKDVQTGSQDEINKALTEFFNKAKIKLAEPVLPQKDKFTRTPAIGIPKLAEGVRKKAIQNKLIYGFDKTFRNLPEYDRVNIKDQATKATELVLSDPERGFRIAMGTEAPPSNILPESVFVAVENYAIETKNVNVLRALATQSELTMQATGMGQRIRMLAERNPDSPATIIRKVADAKKESIEKRLGKNVKEATKKIKADIKKKVKAPDKHDWGKFLDELEC